MCCALSPSSTPNRVRNARFKTGWSFHTPWYQSSPLEQYPGAKYRAKILHGFPKHSGRVCSFQKLGCRQTRLWLWPLHLCGLFPGVTCSLPSRGFFLILHHVRAVCPHLAVPKALCSLKCFDLGLFLGFFLTFQSSPGNVGSKAKQLSTVL